MSRCRGPRTGRSRPEGAHVAFAHVRLFKELEARNRDLTVALEQQTATSEVLRVISSSPTDVQPVFDTIVSSAVRLCDGLFSSLYQFDDELLHLVAQHNFTPEAVASVPGAASVRVGVMLRGGPTSATPTRPSRPGGRGRYR